MKILIKERQYLKLVESNLLVEQDWKGWLDRFMASGLEKLFGGPEGTAEAFEKLGGLVGRIQERLQEPTEKDVVFLRSLTKEQIEEILQYIPINMLMNSSPPDIYPVPLVDPYINSCYGRRWNRCHSGVDLKTKGEGDSQPLIAACAGTVTRAVDDAGDCGGYIKIECNSGHAVGYCHLKVVNKNLYGIQVPKGFPIGVSGGERGDPGSGNSMGPHLHYIIFDESGKRVNPINYLPNGLSIPAGGKVNKSGKFCNPKARC